MLLSILIIVLIAGIVYYHYLQGFFSAAMSAMFAAIAALVAISYHEWLIDKLLAGRMADQATAITLVALFAGTYTILRLIADRVVPGNVRFLLLVDKIGACVAGFLAAAFALGIFVLAAESLYFDSAIAGFERYRTFPHQTIVIPHGRQQRLDSTFAELDQDQFLRGASQSLLIPVDSLTLGLAKIASRSNGSLGNNYPLASIHPDFPTELFAQRVGLQTGSRLAAIPRSCNVLRVATADALPQQDQERLGAKDANIGSRGSAREGEALPPLNPQLTPAEGNMLLIVRVTMSQENADEKTSVVAFSPGSMRLVANRRDYWPTGTLERTVLYANYIDDPLFAKSATPVDLVFEVPKADVLADPSAKDPRIADGVFLEIKRLVWLDLSGKAVQQPFEPAEKSGVIRKAGISG